MTRRWLALTVAVLVAVGACRATSRHDQPWETSHGRSTADGAARTEGASERVSSEAFLDGRARVSAHVLSDVPPFSVLARAPEIAKAPCTGCHTVPLASLTWDGSNGRPRAHWSIALEHAPPASMACATCHAAPDRGQLQTLTGQPVAFDHVYEVCGQCHFTQRADWEGGAHGKRAGGWAPPRVVFNCTECHNPHRPAFESRWPARAGAPGGPPAP
jgi:hypothetical protein